MNSCPEHGETMRRIGAVESLANELGKQNERIFSKLEEIQQEISANAVRAEKRDEALSNICKKIEKVDLKILFLFVII